MRKLAIVAAVAAGALAACGGAKQIGYIGASSGVKPNALKIVEVDADTGEIAVRGSLPVANATYIAVNRARTRLYTSLADPSGEKGKNGGVAVYALDETGMPTHLETFMTGHPAPCHLSLSPDERKLVFAEYGRGTAGWVDLKADGTFVKETLMGIVSEDPTGPNKPRQDRPHCHCARVTPDGKYICIVDLGTDRVKIYSAATGAFVRDLVTTPAGAGPRHITFHPNGRFAFLLFELENYVTSYSYEDGKFTPIQQHKLTPEGFTDFSKAAAIKLSADGKELYCSNRGHESIAVFSVDAATGTLARRGIVKLNGAFPWDFEMLPASSVFAVGFQKDGVLRTYRYDAAACTLSPLAEAKDMGSIFCTCFLPVSGCGTPPAAKALALRAGTCNVRCDNKGDDKAGNGWKDRKGDLFALIRKLDMDVFGMQEVHENQCRDIIDGLPEWTIVDDYDVTTAVAYRKSRFDLVKKGVFWLSETPDVPRSLGWGAKNIRPCLWMILSDKATGRRFCFINTHTDHRVPRARIEGMKLIMERMKTFSEGLPIVFVGDHNCGPATEPAAEARKHLKDARDISEVKDPGPINTFHNWGKIKDVDWRRCDYIYVSDGIRVKNFVTHDDKRPGLDRYPTDHYLLTADLEF